jgi:predicted nuclease with TOPRIM domain
LTHLNYPGLYAIIKKLKNNKNIKKTMSNIQEVFDRIQKTKKEQKEIRNMYRDALSHSGRYQENIEKLKKLKEEKKMLENEIKLEMRAEFDKMEILKNELQNDIMLLSDAALSRLMEGKVVEVTDQNEQKYEPIFTVRFKKS